MENAVETLKSLREKSGLPLQEIASRMLRANPDVPTHYTSILYMESQGAQNKLSTLDAFADALGIDRCLVLQAARNSTPQKTTRRGRKPSGVFVAV